VATFEETGISNMM